MADLLGPRVGATEDMFRTTVLALTYFVAENCALV